MKLLSWNVNGWRASVKKGFFDFVLKENPDILGLQEIKMDEIPKLPLNLSNYHLIWNPAEKKGYAGTAILSKIKPLSIIKQMNKKKFDDEGRVIILEFENFFFVNTYFPNSRHGLTRLDFKIDFNKLFLSKLKQLEKSKPVIACGDYNVAHNEIDIARPKSNARNPGFTIQERNWMSEFLSNGQIDTFRHLHPKTVKYSWWSYRANARTRNIGWRIDYFTISTNLKNKLKSAFILEDIMGSDHAPIGIEMKELK